MAQSAKRKEQSARGMEHGAKRKAHGAEREEQSEKATANHLYSSDKNSLILPTTNFCC